MAFNPIVEEIKIAENTPMIVLFLEKANCQFREHYSLIDSYLNINVWEKNLVYFGLHSVRGMEIFEAFQTISFYLKPFGPIKIKKISLLK